MEVNRARMLDVVGTLTKVAARTGIDSSQYIRIARNGEQQLQLQLSSDAAAIQTLPLNGWPLKEAFYADRRAFISFVEFAKEIKAKSTFKFSEKDGGLLIVNGRRRAHLSSASEIGGYVDVGTIKVRSKILFSEADLPLLKAAVKCAATDPSKPELNCVYLDGKGMCYASNKVVVFAGKISYKGKPVALPLFVAGLAADDGYAEFMLTSAGVAVKLRGGLLLQALVSDPKNFPVETIRQVAVEGEKYPLVAEVKSRDLFDRIKRLYAYAASAGKAARGAVTITAPSKLKSIHLVFSSPVGKFVEDVTTREYHPTPAVQNIPLELAATSVQHVVPVSKTLQLRFGKGTRTCLVGDGFSLLLSRLVD